MRKLKKVSRKKVRENAEKEIAILNERTAEIENSTAESISAEEVCRSLGYVDERTEDEKLRDEKWMRDAVVASASGVTKAFLLLSSLR